MDDIDLTQFEGHTAGPWRVGADLRYVVLGAGRLSRNGMAISLCKLSENSGIRTAEYMPNAALIAAAPDLLAEIKRQAAEIERLRDALRKIAGIGEHADAWADIDAAEIADSALQEEQK